MSKRRGQPRALIFISHCHEDAECARSLREWLHENLLGAVDFFVSTDAASVPPGADWPRRLREALGETTIALCLVSPNSINRKWVYFEAGAAYARNVPVIPLCWGGIGVTDLAPPLSFFQGLILAEIESQLRLVALVAEHAGLISPRSVPQLHLPAVFRGGVDSAGGAPPVEVISTGAFAWLKNEIAEMRGTIGELVKQQGTQVQNERRPGRPTVS